MPFLPNSNQRRGAPAFVKILTRVDPHAPCALGWEGKPCKSGAKFDVAELPVPALALECAFGVKRETVWILWRFDFRKLEWKEMARAESADWAWSVALRPLAIRLLAPEPISVDCASIAKRLAQSIDEELRKLGAQHQSELLSALEIYLAQQIAQCLRR